MLLLRTKKILHDTPVFSFRNIIVATAMLATLATGCGTKKEIETAPQSRVSIVQPIQTERDETEQSKTKQQEMLERILEAKKTLSDPGYQCNKTKKTETVWIATYDKNRISYIQIQAEGRNSTAVQHEFQIIRRTVNGVNSIFEVTHPPDQVVLAIKICVDVKVENGKTETRGAVYTPYCSGLGKMMLATEGIQYVRSKTAEALAELKHAGIDISAFENGTLTPEMILVMVINEHMEQIRRNGAPVRTPKEEKEFVRKEMQRILTIIAANEENAYDYSFSNQESGEFWQARGLVQMIQSTYESLKRKYPSVKFPDNFFEATRDHKNAIKAAILLFLEDYRLLARNGVSNGVSERELIDMLFAAYNCGGPRTVEAIKKHGSSWVTAHTERINALTLKIANVEKRLWEIARADKKYAKITSFKTIEKAARLGKMGHEAQKIANHRRKAMAERETAWERYKKSSISTEAEGYLLKLFYVRQVLQEGVYIN